LEILLKGINDAPATPRMEMLMVIIMLIFLFPRSYLFAIRNSRFDIVKKNARTITQEYSPENVVKIE